MALYINGNKTGGGGGNADIVHLTQAEYDALPDSKLSDNKVYMLEDVNGDGSQFQPVIYSEDEREIGVWVDGKPLYQKTFYLASGSLATGSLDIPNDLTNIDRVIGYSGVVHSDSEDRDFKLPYTRVQYNESIFILNMVLIDDTVATSIISGDHSSYNQLSNIYVTLQYTKTTDTAGSGTWTPQGVPAVHYSTDEQVVGTWVDGSTVYEKTFVTTLPNSPDIGSDSMLIGTLTDFNDIIKIEGTIKDVTANAWCATSGLPWYNGVNGWQYSFHINPSGQLCIWFASNSTQYYNAYKGGKAIATVQYTKSSQGGN